MTHLVGAVWQTGWVNPEPNSVPHVIFVCWGNICRSPMAERIAEGMAAAAGVTARFTSAATSTDEIGSPIDPRAVRVLAAAGYRTSNHRAHQITAEEIRRADLVVGMEQLHIDKMARLLPGATNMALMTDFDPTAAPGTGIDDPWYGPPAGFETTRAELERAMPGLLEWIVRPDGKPARTPGVTPRIGGRDH